MPVEYVHLKDEAQNLLKERLQVCNFLACKTNCTFRYTHFIPGSTNTGHMLAAVTKFCVMTLNILGKYSLQFLSLCMRLCIDSCATSRKWHIAGSEDIPEF